MRVRISYIPQQIADPSEILEELRQFVRAGNSTLGGSVAEIESRFAEVMGARHAIGVHGGR